MVHRGRPLTEIAHSPDLDAKLDRVLNMEGLTALDIETAGDMLYNEVAADRPDLMPIYDLLREFAKESADWTQHRIEAMDRGRAWHRNPVVLFAQQLQSFNMQQTKFLKDLLTREWKIMHELMKESNPIKFMNTKEGAAAVGSLKLLPRMLAIGLPFGYSIIFLQHIARGQLPDAEDLNPLLALIKVGFGTIYADIMWNLLRWKQSGAEDVIVGPTGATVIEAINTRGQSLGRLVRPPLVGPSLNDVLDQGGRSQGRSGSGRGGSSRGGSSR